MAKRNHKIYKESDIILPMLTLPDPCKIIIEIDEDLNEVSLQVGNREWVWDKNTCELIGCGTLITNTSNKKKDKKKAQGRKV